MAKIIESRRDTTGKGWETWIEGDPAPYFNYGEEPLDDKRLDDAYAVRVAVRAEAEKRAAIDVAIDAELDKRKGDDTSLYDKSAEDALDSIFSKDKPADDILPKGVK